MRFDSDSRTRLYADLTLDYDPSSSTVELQVDGTWYPATWLSAPVYSEGNKKWAQTAVTDDYFAGPFAPASDPLVLNPVALTLGRHPTQVRVTSGDQIISHDSSPIDVR